MARVTFDTIFIKHPDNSLEPRQRIRTGGVTLSPGVRLSRGVSIGGIDFTQFLDHDLEIETLDNIIVVTGIY